MCFLEMVDSTYKNGDVWGMVQMTLDDIGFTA